MEEVEEAAQVQAAAKRKREEADIKCWEAKKVDIEEQIAALKDVIRVNRNNVKELIEKGLRTSDPNIMKTNMQTVKFCNETIEKNSRQVDILTTQLQSHIGKKPRKAQR